MECVCRWKFTEKKKKRKNEGCLKHKQSTINCFEKMNFNVLKHSLKQAYNWLHIWGFMIGFLFSAAEVGENAFNTSDACLGMNKAYAVLGSNTGEVKYR